VKGTLARGPLQPHLDTPSEEKAKAAPSQYRSRLSALRVALLDPDEDHGERKQRERFNKGQAENHQQLNGSRCPWVAGNRLHRRANRSSLSDTAKPGGQGDADANADWSQVAASGWLRLTVLAPSRLRPFPFIRSGSVLRRKLIWSPQRSALAIPLTPVAPTINQLMHIAGSQCSWCVASPR